MRTLGNIIWHFPYFGWLRALLYAIGGLFWCITIIGIPLGVGLFQLSLFMLAPFSKGLVSVKDLELVTGEKQDAFVKNWSLVIRILYFPFGLIAAFGMVITIGVEFGTLVGIPCGLAEAKALATVFNPINKRCVPRAIAEEIERRKANNTLNKYVKVQDPSTVVSVSRENVQKIEVSEPILTDEYLRKAQTKTDEELKTILKNRDDYHPQLIKAAEKVLLDRITGVDTPVATPKEEKKDILSPSIASKSQPDDDRYKAYQPKMPSSVSIPLEEEKPKDDSFEIVKEEWKSERSEYSLSKNTPSSEMTESDEDTVLTSAPQKNNFIILLSVLAGVVLAVGGALTYYLWYVPYAKDRDATRMYVIANDIVLHSSDDSGMASSTTKVIPYGTQTLTYDIIGDWAQVKVDGQEGTVAATYLLSTEDFDLLNGAWGNSNVKDCLESTKCRLAILDFYKLVHLESGANGWQIYTKEKDMKPNAVYYPRLYDRDSKFTDFMFLVKDNQTGARRLVCYSFEDETEKPIFRFYVDAPDEGDIKKLSPYSGGVVVLFDNREQLNITL